MSAANSLRWPSVLLLAVAMSIAAAVGPTDGNSRGSQGSYPGPVDLPRGLVLSYAYSWHGGDRAFFRHLRLTYLKEGGLMIFRIGGLGKRRYRYSCLGASEMSELETRMADVLLTKPKVQSGAPYLAGRQILDIDHDHRKRGVETHPLYQGALPEAAQRLIARLTHLREKLSATARRLPVPLGEARGRDLCGSERNDRT